MGIGVSLGWDINVKDNYCECGRRVNDGKDTYLYYILNLMLHGVIKPVREKCPECRKEEGGA